MKKPNATDDTQAQLTNLLTYRLSRVQAKLNMHASRALKAASGISLTHWRILVVVHTYEQTTASELSTHLGWDKGLLSRNIKHMVNAGLLISRTNKDDQRVQRLSLSPRGIEMHSKTLPHMSRRRQSLRSTLTEEERAELLRMLEKMEAFLDTELDL